MTPAGLSPVVNHLWQSTIFAAAAMVLALVLGKNRAQIRYWLWMAASVKFLVPFSLLVSVGSLFEWRSASEVAPPISLAIGQISAPFALPAAPSVVPASPEPAWPVAVWMAGCLVVVTMW